ncbi:ATPase [Alkalihalophilus lindianensis]|uniref:Nuclease SbcCD subunit C n=1 Tax=Alkalihalophilus lindianensis TaxID=1630542 RepID=A0ABU3X7H3_9BACI|nr:ATPase [Alkalihalophilus lindianensis]MDV2683773.1 ATPase [Alkalihalophilus lindianensis]MDV2683839.1 ATPase [Alkalihalophilus lindianensis]
MKITFKELFLTGFKNHRDLTVNFGEETKISGDNGEGKSTVVNAPSWAFFGTDVFKNKLDPTPVTYESEETKVSLILTIDSKEVKLTRELKSGKAKYYINDVPSKATEFDLLVSNLGDKDFFLSLYNPHYFFTLKWDKQREMLLQYVAAPSNKQVLKELHGPQSDKLTELLKKHKLNDIEKIHRENKTKMEKAHISAESRTKTLKGQLDQYESYVISVNEVEDELGEIGQLLEQVDNDISNANEKNRKFSHIQFQLENLQSEIEHSKEKYSQIKNEHIASECPLCNQSLDEDSIEAVKDKKLQRMEEHKDSHKLLLDKKASLKENLMNLERVELDDLLSKRNELDDKRQPLIQALRSVKQVDQLKEQIEIAEQDEQEKLNSLNDSIFIIDAIKAFQAKEAELQGEKVQALFTTLSVRLFEEQKNGDIKPTFVIQMDGKDYKMLSLSESIKAGLELREVLSEQSGVVAPTFVDNAESITAFKGPTGQLITSRVVADQELKIEVSE